MCPHHAFPRTLTRLPPPAARRGTALLLAAVLLTQGSVSRASESELAGLYNVLRGQLEASSLQRPLLLQSSDTPSGLQGDVYAVVEYPAKAISAALNDPARWCEAMLLHVNNRACTVARDSGKPVITLSVVRKYDQPLDSAFRLPFEFRLVDATAQHLSVQLASRTGPLGTSNYRIAFEAVALGPSRSFLHFSYAYDENMLARTATQAYLATFGRNKVGFTVVGRMPGGQPDLVRGTQGLMERNAMRYFLAVDAYLAASDAPARWNAWYAATEKYPRQLHEIEQAAYLALKQADARR